MNNTDRILLTIAQLLSIGLMQFILNSTNDKSTYEHLARETEQLMERLKSSLSN